ncbi:avidin/streptavidin family protein [Zestomonas carbonaria]|uniref:Uncharacterized protein n=1 Tax=Zestomonas carbonaria TaxID=2762745 RepID=A0A7U7EQ85_9GAMM|nr:avidin/streptavidin family protein [Pseudomonas carbonaria]CAD5108667.1 hypothetical protein PSEWESI4_02959 [Pseudomonas carbonaria]
MSAEGIWKNEYGSIMMLSGKGHVLSGIYQSSTSMVGTYEVRGVRVGRRATESYGQPLALAISWHSMDDANANPSWHWCSGLSGQLSVRDGVEVLVLSHSLVAPNRFPGLVEDGTYIDRMTYRRLGGAERIPLPVRVAGAPDNPLAGVWEAPDGTSLALEVGASLDNRLGYVSGTLHAASELEVSGFTDLHAVGNGLSRQAVTLTAVATSERRAISLSGTLDLEKGTLALLDLSSEPTPPHQHFGQTRISSSVYRRRLAS